MRTETIEIYKFVELSDEGKECAREWWRAGMDYPWMDDSMNSILSFCGEFGVMVQEWSINPYGSAWIETNAANESFRGVRLKSVKRDAMPTGYCLDCTLWMTFHDEFKRTGSALYAFNEAIDAAAKEIRSDMEYQLSDEAVNEMLEINEYEFTADGRIH
jgi:hypothetical protein